MGCDGGSIPKRRELVKTKQNHIITHQQYEQRRWFTCALSMQPLSMPIVSCCMGRLYNKEAIITYLLQRKQKNNQGNSIVDHITCLKDVVTLNLTLNPTMPNYDVEYAERNHIPLFICPVTRKEMNNQCRFVYLNPCGCVFSQQAITTMIHHGVTQQTCLLCNKPYDTVTVIYGE